MLTMKRARSGATVRTMDERRYGLSEREAPHPRLTRRWQRQAVLVVLIAMVVVGGQPAAASYATSGPAGVAGRMASVARAIVKPAPSIESVTGIVGARDAVAPATDSRPDFLVTFAHLDDAQAGRPFSYTLQVRNEGTAGGAVTVSTVLPPELSNVRVMAPGFVCTRRFSASGAQIGTLVTCTRNDLESGGSADLTIEANAPAGMSSFRLTAAASSRDDVPEADATNNDIDVTVLVHG